MTLAFSSPKGIIFDIQRFSVHDGPGIRTTVFFKGCPLRCAWCQNPESLRPGRELAYRPDRCQGTGGCFSVCKKGALLKTDERLARDLCDACGLCVPECPYQAYELVGREVPAEALVEELLADRPFFDASSGGVTLSGGEPTLQPEFLGAVASGLCAKGVSVVLQTCGAFAWDRIKPFLPCFRLIHFDLKVMDRDHHRRLTGAANGTILENARNLMREGFPVIFRMPVIPGLTDTDENVLAVAGFLNEVKMPRLRLLPYHPLGEAKLAALGFPLAPLSLAHVPHLLERPRTLLAGQGLEVTC